MLDFIQNQPVTKAINESLKPLFLVLFFASISALFFNWTGIKLFYQAALIATSLLPLFVAFVLSYALTSSIAYAMLGSIGVMFHPYFLPAFFIPVAIYLFHHYFEKIMKKHFFKELPQFVENSVKDVVVCLFFLLLIFFPWPSSLPCSSIFDSLVFCILIIFLNCYAFYKGYHPSVLNAFIGPIEIVFLAENIQAFLYQRPLVHFLTHGTMSAMANLSGTGITIGIALLAKRKLPQKTLLSGFFGVNEQVIFGLPIAMTKETFIPFVLGGTINGAIPIVLMYLGYLHKPIFDAPYLGIGLEGFLVNFDIRTIFVAMIQVVISIVIWYPYYRKPTINKSSKNL